MNKGDEVVKAGTKALLTTLLWSALILTIFMIIGCGGGEGGNLASGSLPAVLPSPAPLSSKSNENTQALATQDTSDSLLGIFELNESQPQATRQLIAQPQVAQQLAANTNYQAPGSWSRYSAGYVTIGSSGTGASTTWSVSGSRSGSVSTEIATYTYNGKLSGTLIKDSDRRNVGAAVTGNVNATFSPAKYWGRESVDQIRIRFTDMQHRTHDGGTERIKKVSWFTPGFGLLQPATKGEPGAFAVLENGDVVYQKVVAHPDHRYAGYGVVNPDGTFSFSDVYPDVGDPANSGCALMPVGTGCKPKHPILGNVARTRNTDHGTMSGAFYGSSYQAIGATFTFSSSGKQVKGAFGAKR